jgi:glutamate-1-semialdehyde 2,1-aminomutase
VERDLVHARDRPQPADVVTGSYGVNVLGTDAYRDCIREGAGAVEALGPVLGALHPVVADNVRRLRAISGMDEVSFHMSAPSRMQSL